MIIQEFLILIPSFIAIFVVTGQYFYYAMKHASRPEAKLMAIGMLCFLMHILFYLLSAYFHNPNLTSDLGILMNRYGALMATLGTLFWAITFYLPNLKLTYRSILTFGLIITLYLSTGFINVFTLNQQVVENVILPIYEPLGFSALIITIIATMVLLTYRINQISKSGTAESNNIFAKNKSILILLMFFLIFVLILNLLIPYNLPGYAYSIPLTIFFTFFGYISMKDQTFWFTTPIKFYSLSIIHKLNGMELYQKVEEVSNGNSSKQNVFAGQVLNAVNITVRSVIASSEHLEQINYGDKVVLVSVKEGIVLFFIVSESNLITRSITDFLATKFEQMFESELSQYSKVVNITEFKAFDPIFESVRRYFSY